MAMRVCLLIAWVILICLSGVVWVGSPVLILIDAGSFRSVLLSLVLLVRAWRVAGVVYMHVGGSIPWAGSASCLGIACMRSLVACLARIPGAQLQVVHFGANCFFRGDARVGGIGAPLAEPHIAGSSACGGSLWAGGRNGCGDLRDRVLHTCQCEAKWGGWGALESLLEGMLSHQSACLPSCEELHGAWCPEIFQN